MISVKKVLLPLLFAVIIPGCQPKSLTTKGEILKAQIETFRGKKATHHISDVQEKLVVTVDVPKRNISTDEAMLRHPAPTFKFLFPCIRYDDRCVDGVKEIEMPSNGNGLMESFFEDTVRFHYIIRNRYASLTESEKTLLLERHSDNMDRFYKEIRSTSIETPAGGRSITDFETGQLTEQFNRFAQEVVELRCEPKVGSSV